MVAALVSHKTLQRIPLVSGPKGASYANLPTGATAVQTAPSVVTNIQPHQIVAASTVLVQLAVPAGSGSVDVPFSIPLGIPGLQLAPAASGLVIVTLDVAAQPAGAFAVFSKQFAPAGKGPSNAWTIAAGSFFSGANVTGVMRVISSGAVGAQTITVVCSSVFYGIPVVTGQ